MNKLFVSKVDKLRQSIPVNKLLKLLKESMRSRACSFTMKAVHPDEVLEIIKNLKNSKSTGLDFLDTYIIKLVA